MKRSKRSPKVEAKNESQDSNDFHDLEESQDSDVPQDSNDVHDFGEVQENDLPDSTESEDAIDAEDSIGPEDANETEHSIEREDPVEAEDAAELSPILKTAEARTAPRIFTKLQTIVHVKEGVDNSWKEITDVVTISKNGAGFSLRRPCSVGRLVTLIMPMPPEMRAYDKNEKLYPVMGVVQYCNEAVDDGEPCYHVGVALIGKEIPASFKENPLQSYRITGMTDTGLWAVVETQTTFKARRHPRYCVALNVAITVLQKEKKVILKEQTVTLNVGVSGASIKCGLDAKIDDKVKFAYKEFDFFTLAVVRNRRENIGQTPTLHLEFIGNEFPVKKLFTMRSRQGTLEAQPLIETDPRNEDPVTNRPPQHDETSVEFEFERY